MGHPAFLFVSSFLVTVLGARKSAVIVFSKFSSAFGPSWYSGFMVPILLCQFGLSFVFHPMCARYFKKSFPPQDNSTI